MVTKYTINTRAFKIAIAAAGFDSYAELARAAGVSDRTVSAIARGKRPTSTVMYKLADALHLTGEEAGKIFFSDKLRTA